MPFIAVLRHAPTHWNSEKRLQGRTDIPLSAEGRAIAQSWVLPREWHGYRLYCSPLKRARETAFLLFPGKEVMIEPRLVEMDFGTWEGKRLAELRQEGDNVQREAQGLDFAAPSGESPRQVQERLLPFLRELKQDCLLVTHKAVARALYALATGWPMLGKPPHKLHDHCARLFAWDGHRLQLKDANVPLLPDPNSRQE